MKKILLTIDGSDASFDAARFLARLPHTEAMELTVVTAIAETPSRKTFLADGWSESWIARKHHQAEQSFSKVQEYFDDADIKWRQIIRQGQPGETIVAIAKEHRPDLLVIGSKGYSTVARLLQGSVSDFVATHVPCSVLVVRPNSQFSGRHRLRVAIGCEPTEPSGKAVEEFAEFGWASNTEVRVLSVTDNMDEAELPHDAPATEVIESVVERLNDVASTTQGHLIHCDHIGDGLVDYIETNQVDLVVVGETPRSDLGRVLLGSTTRFVLRHSPSSVWIARNQSISSNPPNAALQHSIVT
ncbi:Universal stress protein family [Rhodopirellula islandica]|uniref:Universal stress protein family n=1 Tax=Rhodopirellula islandica TaxID=595434 RepID=A0A0J1BF82_RHOIS|nr:universal stress protein [Rhodopirellula islandica]KLU05232.1 Universal stress protein family [Rhodopirellula islandica]